MSFQQMKFQIQIKLDCLKFYFPFAKCVFKSVMFHLSLCIVSFVKRMALLRSNYYILPIIDKRRPWSLHEFWAALKRMVQHWLKKLWPFSWPWNKVDIAINPNSLSAISVIRHEWRIENFQDRLQNGHGNGMRMLMHDDDERRISTTFGPSPIDPLQFRVSVNTGFHEDTYTFDLSLVSSDKPITQLYFNTVVIDSNGREFRKFGMYIDLQVNLKWL